MILAMMLMAIPEDQRCLPSVDAVLQANRAATASDPSRALTTALTYQYVGQGLEGRIARTFDTSSGMYLERSVIGPMETSSGFDGRVSWMSDLSGHSSFQEGGDRPALARNEAYRLSNAWWRPDRGGAKILLSGCDRLSVAPVGGQLFQVSFDPVSHLLVGMTETRSFGAKAEVRFSEYRNVAGVRTPYVIETITNGDPANSERLTLIGVQQTAGHSPATFARPVRQPRDWEMPATHQVTVPFRLLNNHVVVDVRVDGRGPFPFIVDTGGHDILTPSTIAALGVSTEGVAVAGGAGEKSATAGYARTSSLELGGATLRNQTVVTLDFSPTAVEGLQLGGMLGVEFLERFVVKIDYGGQTLTLMDPRFFDHPKWMESGSRMPFRFYEHMPQVSGSIDGIPARFNIDTGSRSDVTLTSPFVEAARLRNRYKGVTTTDGWGVGGPSRSLVTRAGYLELGGVRVDRPLAGLSAARAGSFSDASYDGNIGSGLLKRFALTIDYGRQELYLRPLTVLDADVSQFDRSGMWVNLAEGGFEIVDLAKDGPASAAGLTAGDVLVSLAGRSLEGITLSDVRRTMKLLPIGSAVAVGFVRSGHPMTATIIPRDLVPE